MRWNEGSVSPKTGFSSPPKELPRFEGFFEKEIRKDDVPIPDNDSNPDAPQPREMVDIEVRRNTINSRIWQIRPPTDKTPLQIRPPRKNFKFPNLVRQTLQIKTPQAQKNTLKWFLS